MLAPCLTAKRSIGGVNIPQAPPCQAAGWFKEEKSDKAMKNRTTNLLIANESLLGVI